MQQALGTLFKKRQVWLPAGILVVALVAILTAWNVFMPQAASAGSGEWLNQGVLKHEGKTFVLQKRDFGSSKGASYPYTSPFDDNYGVNEQDSGIMSSGGGGSVIYAPAGTPTCIDKNNKEFFHEYISFTINADVNSYGRGTYHKVNANDKDVNGNLNCTFAAGQAANISSPANRRIWFFKDGDKVYSFDKSITFTKGGDGPGGADLYFRDGDATAPTNGVVCRDMLVNDGGSWFIFPMGPKNEVASYFSPGRNARSEDYDRYTQQGGRSTANCLVNSLELRTEMLVGVLVPGPNIKGRENEKCPGNIPGSVRWSDADQFGRACTEDSGDFWRLHTVGIQNQMARYSDADFTALGGDNGFRLVRGVSNVVPEAVPDAGAGIITKPGTASSSIPTETCSIASYSGFLLCGAAALADTIVTAIQGIITSLLDVNPLNVNSGDNIFKIWDALRNVANIAFIIAFLIIVFSQATSIGLTNYGIKRLLPRLVMVAILANISYYLCAIAIDLFNVLGAGIQGLVTSIVGDAGFQLSGLNLPPGTGAAEKITLTGIGVGALSLLIKAKGIEAIIIPMLIGVLILVIAVLALLVRQVLLLGFVAGSSVLAVAYLLPNTESIARRGIRFFGQLLVMYPLIILVFAGGHLFALVIVSTAPPDPSVRVFYVGLALLAKWAVLGLIPWLFTAGGFAVGWLFQKGSQLSQKAGQGIRGSRGIRMREEAREAAKNKAYIDRLTGVRGGVRARINRATRRVAMSPFAGTDTDARKELDDKLQDLRLGLEEKRLKTTRTALGQEAGINAAHLARMRRGESVSQYANRVNASFTAQEQNELGRLQTMFSNQLGSSDFKAAAVLTAQDVGADVKDVRAATQSLVETMQAEGMSPGQINNRMLGLIGTNAKNTGFGSLKYATLNQNGVYSEFGTKTPAGAAANIPLTTISESGQIYDSTTGNFTDFGNGLISTAISDPTVNAARFAEAMKTVKGGARVELQRAMAQIDSQITLPPDPITGQPRTFTSEVDRIVSGRT